MYEAYKEKVKMRQKSKGGGQYHFINMGAREAHKDLVKRNSRMTPQELEMDERFEDVPEKLSNRDRDYGKVVRVPTSEIVYRRSGSHFDE